MITVFIPALDEEDLIEHSPLRVHQILDSRALPHEIIVVSNGSTDQTAALGRALAEQHHWFRFAHIPERGAGLAFREGLRMARGDLVICLDMDLSSDLAFIDYAIDLLQYADFVAGSKTMGAQRRSPVRVIGSYTYIMLTNLLCGLTISDYSIGCKAFKRDLVLPALDNLDYWTGYMLEIMLYLKLRGHKVIQVGIDCTDKRRSHFNLLHEGWYRYAHLFRIWKATRNPDAWLYSKAV